MMCYLLNLSQWDYKMVHLLLSLEEEDLMSSFFLGRLPLSFSTSSTVILVILSYIIYAFIQLAQFLVGGVKLPEFFCVLFF